MVCELVGSAALSSRLDPEDLREVIAAYRRVVAKIVAGFDGFVGKSMGEYIGEGVLVYFGYPTAQENDAERAVRAALAIQRALSEHNSEKVNKGAPELSARIGLDCELVVVDFDRRGVWRRAECRRSYADRRRAGNSSRHHQRSAPGARSLCHRRAQRERTRWYVRTCQPVPRRAREWRPAAGSRAAADALHRSRGGIGPADAPMGARAGGRRSARLYCRRAGHRQVATGGGVPCKAGRNITHLGRVERSAALAEYAACIQSPNGVAFNSAWRRLRNSASPISRTLWRWSGSIPPNMRRCWPPSSTSRCRRPRRESAARRVAAEAARGGRRMVSGGSALTSLSRSLSRTCNGLIRLRSISCGLSPSAGPRRRSSSSQLRGRSSSRPGACARTTA